MLLLELQRKMVRYSLKIVWAVILAVATLVGMASATMGIYSGEPHLRDEGQ